MAEEPDQEEGEKEALVRKHMQRMAEAERSQYQEQMGRLIADIDRVCDLNESQEDRLTLGSKGAVDVYLTHWREQMEGWVRKRTTTVNEDVDQFLANMGGVRFGESKEWMPQRQEVWVAAVREVLTESQLQAYREDLAARRSFKHQAMAQVAVADLDGRIKLSPQQREVILPLVEASAEEYWDRLQSWSGGDENLPFHYLGVILGGIPKEELEQHLTEEQLKGFNMYFANFSGVWKRIQEMEEPASFYSLLQ